MFDFLIDIIPREDATGWEGGDGGPSAGGSNGAKNGGNGKGKGKAGKGGRKRKTSVDEEDEEGNGEGGSEVAGSVQSDEHGEAGPSKRARRTATKQEYEEEVLNGGVDEGINLQLGGAPAPLPMTTTAEHQEYLLEQYRQQQAGVQPVRPVGLSTLWSKVLSTDPSVSLNRLRSRVKLRRSDGEVRACRTATVLMRCVCSFVCLKDCLLILSLYSTERTAVLPSRRSPRSLSCVATVW